MTYLLSDSSILSAELFIQNVRVESFNEGFGTE